MVYGVQEFRGVCRRFRERHRWSMEFMSSKVCIEGSERDTDGLWSSGNQRCV